MRNGSTQISSCSLVPVVVLLDMTMAGAWVLMGPMTHHTQS